MDGCAGPELSCSHLKWHHNGRFSCCMVSLGSLSEIGGSKARNAVVVPSTSCAAATTVTGIMNLHCAKCLVLIWTWFSVFELAFISALYAQPLHQPRMPLNLAQVRHPAPVAKAQGAKDTKRVQQLLLAQRAGRTSRSAIRDKKRWDPKVGPQGSQRIWKSGERLLLATYSRLEVAVALED